CPHNRRCSILSESGYRAWVVGAREWGTHATYRRDSMFAHHGRVEMATRVRITKNKRRSRKRCCNVLSRAPAGIFETDIHGHCVFVNPRWLDMAGLTLDQAIGKHWSQAAHPHAVVHPDDCERLRQRWEQAIASKGTFECECRYRRRPDG